MDSFASRQTSMTNSVGSSAEEIVKRIDLNRLVFTFLNRPELAKTLARIKENPGESEHYKRRVRDALNKAEGDDLLTLGILFGIKIQN